MPAYELPKSVGISGEFRKMRAAARYCIRPKDVDGISVGEMALMLAIDDVLRAEERIK